MALFKKGQVLPLKRTKHDITDDCYVFIREMSAQEQIAFRKKMNAPDDYKEHAFLWDVIALCVCDESGNALFNDAQDVAEHFLIAVSQAQRLVEAILDISGFKNPDEKKV